MQDALNKGDSMTLPHRIGPVGTMKAWVNDGYWWIKLTRETKIIKGRWSLRYKHHIWKIQFWKETKWPFLEKWLSSEVSNHQKIEKTDYNNWWEISNGVEGSSNWATVWSQWATEKMWFFLWKDIFPPIWIHFLSELWWIWRGGRGRKSCGDHSRQTNHWN